MQTERNQDQEHRPSGIGRHVTILVTSLAATLTLSGCITTMSNEGPPLPKTYLPVYYVGKSFSYDDGLKETVMALDGEVLTWRTDTGVIRTRYRNFLIPFLSWQNSTQRSRSITSAKPDLVWPLEIGNRESFSLTQKVEQNDGTNKKEYSQDWQCKVDGTETVTVPAGVFETFRIPCYRYYRQFWRQTQTYFYSPVVGHYVLLQDDSRSRPSRRRKLLSYGFDAAVLSGPDRGVRQTAIQRALEQNRDGAGVPWKSADGKVQGRVTPIRPVSIKGNNACRIYTRAVTAYGHTRVVEGRACRNENGVWWETNTEK